MYEISIDDMVRTLSSEELVDFIYGAAVFGTGGGGSIESALDILQEVKSRKVTFNLVDPDEIPDDSVIACPYGVGGGVSDEIRRRFESLPRLTREIVLDLAVKAFETHLGKRIDGFIPGEMGAGNSLLAMYIASLNDRYTVDGDTVGRSVPEVIHSTFTICKVEITPFVVATPFGDVMIVTRVLNDQRAEDIDRFMAVASGGGVTVIDHPVEGRILRKSIVPNTVTKSIDVGRSIRKARERGSDPIQALIESAEGCLLFEGEIENLEREGREGFVWGVTKLNGIRRFRGGKYKVWFKNENLVTWLNDTPHVTCPDLISLVDGRTAQALSNWGDELFKGREVAVVGMRAPEIWRTEKGLEILSPRYFGFDIDYKPIEKIVEGL